MAISTVGFIGLGAMGLPMARRLLGAGLRLVVQDADPARAALLGDTGYRTARTLADWAEVDCLVTMLPHSGIVESVLLQDGVADALRPGTLVVDMSSSEPLRSSALEKTLQSRGLAYIDAPVSGGVKKAVDGALAIMVGGDKALMEQARPVLEAVGKTLFHVGPAGAGHAAKALNNFVSAAHLVATVEALHAAERFGIDPYVMTDVLNASSGKSATTENKAKQFMLSGTFASGFALKLMTKDVRIANDLIHALSTPSAMADEVLSIWSEASEHCDAQTDHTAMYLLLSGR